MAKSVQAKAAARVAVLRIKTRAAVAAGVTAGMLAVPAIASASPYSATSVTPPGGIGAKTNTLLGYLTWGGGLCCVVGIITIGAMMALSHHNGRGAGEHAGKIGTVAVAAILIGSSVAVVSALL